jgi:hypothetical protein
MFLPVILLPTSHFTIQRKSVAHTKSNSLNMGKAKVGPAFSPCAPLPSLITACLFAIYTPSPLYYHRVTLVNVVLCGDGLSYRFQCPHFDVLCCELLLGNFGGAFHCVLHNITLDTGWLYCFRTSPLDCNAMCSLVCLRWTGCFLFYLSAGFCAPNCFNMPILLVFPPSLPCRHASHKYLIVSLFSFSSTTTASS